MSKRDEFAEKFVTDNAYVTLKPLVLYIYSSGYDARNPEVEALKKQIEEIADMFCINDMCECGTCRAKVFRAGWMKEEQVKR